MSRGQLAVEIKVIGSEPFFSFFVLDRLCFIVFFFLVLVVSPPQSLYDIRHTYTMPHTLLVSFSLLALVVTARPIAPVSYVFNRGPRRPGDIHTLQ